MSISKKLFVGAMVVGAAGLLWYSCRNTAAAKDGATTRALEYVPADAEVIVGFDIDGMRKSSVAWEMFEQRLEADPEFRSLKKACNYDLADGIPRFTIAVRDIKNLHPTGVFVVQGHGVGKLVDCIAKDSITRRDGDTFFVGTRRNNEAAMRLADRETLVGVFGDHTTKGELDEVIARSGRSITDVASFDEVYRQIDTTSTTWFIVKGSVFDKFVPLSSHTPRAFGGSVNIDKKITGSFVVRFDSASDAADMVGDTKRIASFLDEQITIDHDGADLKVQFTFTPETTRKMLRDLGTDW